MIDPSIPLMAKGIDSLQMLDDGNKLAQLWQGQKTDAEMNRIYKQAGGDQGKMMQLGQQSALARLVMPQLQAQQAAQQKALLDQQKAQADISKTNSEAFKNNQQGSGFGLDNGQKQLGAIQSAWQQASMNGDKSAAMIGLDAAQRVKLISPEDYQQQQKLLMAMTPEEVKTYAQSVTFANAKDPASIAFQTANNVADNATSIANNTLTNQTSADNNIRTNQTSENNNIRTTDTSRYSTDVAANTAQQKLSLEQAKIELDQKKGTVQQFGDNMYMVYPNGSAVPISSAVGPVTKNTTAPALKQAQQEEGLRTQRVDAVLPEIKTLLESTKGGYINTGLDMLGGAVGYSTDTAKTTAQLKALSGQLVALMPKMSGPQSDKDVAMYKEMAGNLADPTTPTETRMAALETIDKLNQKYKDLNGGSIPVSIAKPSGGPKPNALDFFK